MGTSPLDRHALKMHGVKLEFGNPEHIKAKKTFEELAHIEDIEEELQMVCDECDSNMHIDTLNEAAGWIFWRCDTECSHCNHYCDTECSYCNHYCDEVMYTDLQGNIISGRPKAVAVQQSTEEDTIPLPMNWTITTTSSGEDVPTCWREIK